MQVLRQDAPCRLGSPNEWLASRTRVAPPRICQYVPRFTLPSWFEFEEWLHFQFPVLEYTRRTPRSRTTRRGKHPEEEHTRTPQWTVFDTCTYMYLPVHLWYTMLQSMAPLQIAKHIAKDRTRKQWSIRACRLLPVLEANGVTEYWVCPYHLIRHKKQNCKFYKLTFLFYFFIYYIFKIVLQLYLDSRVPGTNYSIYFVFFQFLFWFSVSFGI